MSELLPRISAHKDGGFDESRVVAAEVVERGLARILAPGAPTFEQFRVLRSKVESIAEKRAFRCIGVTSAMPGEGKTMTALGLAMALSQRPRHRVLLVEAALRAPALEGALGIASEPGLREWLEGDGFSAIAVRRVDPWGFFLLGAGSRAGHAGELLNSDRMRRVLEAARQAYDFVVVDSPSLTPHADAVFLQGLLDGFFLVVRSRHAQKEALLHAVAQLEPAAIQGVVYNAHRGALQFLRRLGLSRSPR